MATNTWSPTSGNNWSTDANWSLGHKPTTGEDVTFDHAVSDGNCTIDEATATLATFGLLTGYLGTVTNAANAHVTTTSDITISSGTTTSRTDCMWTCGGSFLQTGGTITQSVLSITFSGSGKSITCSVSGNAFYNLIFNDDTTIVSTVQAVHDLTVSTGKLVTVSSGKILYWNPTATSTYTNLGALGGLGTLELYSDAGSANKVVTFGTVNVPVLIYGQGGIPADRAITLGANTVFGSTLNINSAHASRTMSLLAGASNYQLQVAGLATVGATGVVAQGTGKFQYDGGFLVNGAGNGYTQTGTMLDTVVNGTMRVSTDFAPTGSWRVRHLIVDVTKTLTIAAGQIIRYNSIANAGTIAGAGRAERWIDKRPRPRARRC